MARFGRYELLERLSVGGMAEVFLAKSFGAEGFERILALKRILPQIASNPEFTAMFVDEAKIASQLTHANIVQILELGRAEDTLFIAMEYVHGKDLRTVFQRCRIERRMMPLEHVLHVVMRVCEGLDYAHNKRDAAGRRLEVIHRDVTPQNVMLSYDGEVKLVDFGIAKATSRSAKTRAGMLKGNFAYMSPEQARGLPVDRRSDLFSVGVILYELLTGERLFASQDDVSTLEKVRNAVVVPPSRITSRVEPALERLVLRALSRHERNRFQDASELHDYLFEYARDSGKISSRRELSSWLRAIMADEVSRNNAVLARHVSNDGIGLSAKQPDDQTGPFKQDADLRPTDESPAVARRNKPEHGSDQGSEGGVALGDEQQTVNMTGRESAALRATVAADRRPAADGATAIIPRKAVQEPNEGPSHPRAGRVDAAGRSDAAASDPFALPPPSFSPSDRAGPPSARRSGDFLHHVLHDNVGYEISTQALGLPSYRVRTRICLGSTLVAELIQEYRDMLSADDFGARLQRMMQEQHKAALKRLKHGEFDARAGHDNVPSTTRPVEQQAAHPNERRHRITALVGALTEGPLAPETAPIPGAESIPRPEADKRHDTEEHPVMKSVPPGVTADDRDGAPNEHEGQTRQVHNVWDHVQTRAAPDPTSDTQLTPAPADTDD